ncbi:MAG: tRNA 2-thiouridine(34) synthase MnmA [Pseudomonadales bacterium]
MAHQAAKRVIVGMSGGVDSSVAAYLLLQQGYQVEGLFMKNWNDDDGTEYCTAMTDLADAAHVAQTLGIKLHTANFASEYWDRVFQHFLSEYKAGRTPNPDILCNKEIKFRAFLDHALALGADAIATGHYARMDDSTGEARLLKGLDPAKDQSYFLHAVSAQQLQHTLFPLGELLKTEVREIAEQQGLITHDKKDSTGICFIGERRFKDFLMQYIPAQEGDICSLDGESLGRHAGLMFHTIGQRQGLGIGGKKGQPEKAWYVAAKDLERNVLKVVQGNDHPALFAQSLTVEQLEWVNGKPPSANTTLHAKIRYRQNDQTCELLDNTDQDCCTVHFEVPQRAISPGQSCVFYAGEHCLGGGIIRSALRSPVTEAKSA